MDLHRDVLPFWCRKWLDAVKQPGKLRLAWVLAPISARLIQCWSSNPTSLLKAQARPALAFSCYPRLALQSVFVTVVPSCPADSVSHCALALSVCVHRGQQFCLLCLVHLESSFGLCAALDWVSPPACVLLSICWFADGRTILEHTSVCLFVCLFVGWLVGWLVGCLLLLFCVCVNMSLKVGHFLAANLRRWLRRHVGFLDFVVDGRFFACAFRDGFLARCGRTVSCSWCFTALFGS